MTRKESLAIDKTSRRLELQKSSGKRKKRGGKSIEGTGGRRLLAGGIVDASRPHQKPWQARIDEHKRKQKLQFKGLAFLRENQRVQGKSFEIEGFSI